MMNDSTPAIKVQDLARRFGRAEAVCGLSLSVQPGRCYGFFGRNGAGKTTTIKCLLNLLRPDAGKVRVFGHDPYRHEVEVKRRIGYVPEVVAFYPWMTARGVLDYTASFHQNWSRELEAQLLGRFELDAKKKVKAMSKGMRAQLALICAICPEPDLLLLDEPTSGLDPVVRREFIKTVIGAYQEGGPERRTVFISTHLIQEFEGLIDEFTIIDEGRNLLTLTADEARERYCKIRLRFPEEPPELAVADDILSVEREGRELEVTTDRFSTELVERLRKLAPESLNEERLSLEEIFIAADRLKSGARDKGGPSRREGPEQSSV
jgi:ABC-2 type transport system ATP-binding protein